MIAGTASAAAVQSRGARVLSWVLWPTIYGAGLIGVHAALASTHPLLGFNIVYASVALVIGILERLMPHEVRWLEADGETRANLSHTLLTKGLVQVAAAAVTTAAMLTATAVDPASRSAALLWPQQWPLFAQVVLGLAIAELGLYVAHRIAHEWPPFWRFHALHHSVTRLWVVNTGRFHIVDTCFKGALGQIPLYVLGAPLPVFLWISAVTAITGLLTHCNVVMHTGPLDYVFSTPGLHRWHHSRVPAEGNRNYGENLVLWDLVFGTYFNPPRRPPADIGIDGRIASGFLRQLAQPFSGAGAREIAGDAATPMT
ncbi:MAG: sterol desaturase family protein [Dokdonella sp.]|uniref:sterol desaturase family protein n=1 Tax=Dokdonella sp. TaxID=2291710 RepID=UPI003265F42A